MNNNKSKIHSYKTLRNLVTRIRDDLNDHDFVLLFAYNGTGKTRLSMAFKDAGKKKYKSNLVTKGGSLMVTKSGDVIITEQTMGDTLYFNAFTEDLFSWDNDLQGDAQRHLCINSESAFFKGLEGLDLEGKIGSFLERYADFDFKIDYENWKVIFSRGDEQNIKVSRGEQNIFIWCIFLAICELAIDNEEQDQPYSWVKNIYIDDPISSLDDNNAIAVASDLAQLLKREKELQDKDKNGDEKKKRQKNIKAVISSHHGLFFNVMWNELRKNKLKTYLYHRPNKSDVYTLRATDETPFFHHVAMLSELKKAVETDQLYTHHFNMMRSILEKTATFFGFKDFSKCIEGVEDEVLYSRALNLLSHGKYSIYEPKEMVDDTKELFKKIFNAFLDRYKFDLPEIIKEK
jgi:AAA domain